MQTWYNKQAEGQLTSLYVLCGPLTWAFGAGLILFSFLYYLELGRRVSEYGYAMRYSPFLLASSSFTAVTLLILAVN